MLDNILWLKLQVEAHQKWLKGKKDGKCADLRNKFCDIGSPPDASRLLAEKNLAHANLTGVDMHSYKYPYQMDLKTANFEGAELPGANLSMADLSYVNFTNANLEGSNFSYAKLGGAELFRANLSGTKWEKAEFQKYLYNDEGGGFYHVANLAGANLSGANLQGAILEDITIDYQTIELSPVCPMEGSFIAYKLVDNRCIVLEIPADAKRVSGTTFKCRCDKAKVLRIENLSGTISSKTKIKNFEVGKIVSVKNFNYEEGEGITFFMSKD